ncbi:MAG: HXXEE domain-containing protein [Lachnospiraceae bacterium]|nr:HXXEE domain-containing protein [Lachnospiraceae bacterium]
MSVQTFILLNFVIYLPFHLFEEAIGDFPRWMYDHKWLPYHMTHGHWMANNLFIYYPMLLISAFLFVVSDQLSCFGAGILVWGVINFGDHFFYTIKDKKISPGLFTGILFLVNSIAGLHCFMTSEVFSMPRLIMGIIIGLILFGLPVGLCVVIYPFFDKYTK